MDNTLRILLCFTLIQTGYCGFVILKNETSIDAVVGNNISIIFKVKPGLNNNSKPEKIYVIRLYIINMDQYVATMSSNGLFATGTIPPNYKNRLSTYSPDKSYSTVIFTIANARYDDNVTVWCQALFEKLDGSTYRKQNETTISNIYGGPDYHASFEFPQYITVDVDGTNPKLSITLEGNPRPNVTWNLDGTEITRATVSALDERKKNFNYTVDISPVGKEMDGKFINFTATGYNENSLFNGAKLNVTWGPDQCQSDTSVVINKMESTLFTAVACANPMPKVEWIFGGKPMANNDTVIMNDKFNFTTDLSSVLETSMCGTILEFKVTGLKGRKRTSKHVISFTFTPKPPSISESYNNGKCIVLKISKENTGKCDLFYNITYLDEMNKELDTIVVKASDVVTHCKKYNSPVSFAYVRGISNVAGVSMIGNLTTVSISTSPPPAPPTSNRKCVLIGALLAAISIILVIIMAVIIFYIKKRKDTPISLRIWRGTIGVTMIAVLLTIIFLIVCFIVENSSSTWIAVILGILTVIMVILVIYMVFCRLSTKKKKEAGICSPDGGSTKPLHGSNTPDCDYDEYNDGNYMSVNNTTNMKQNKKKNKDGKDVIIPMSTVPVYDYAPISDLERKHDFGPDYSRDEYSSPDQNNSQDQNVSQDHHYSPVGQTKKENDTPLSPNDQNISQDHHYSPVGQTKKENDTPLSPNAEYCETINVRPVSGGEIVDAKRVENPTDPARIYYEPAFKVYPNKAEPEYAQVDKSKKEKPEYAQVDKSKKKKKKEDSDYEVVNQKKEKKEKKKKKKKKDVLNNSSPMQSSDEIHDGEYVTVRGEK